MLKSAIDKLGQVFQFSRVEGHSFCIKVCYDGELAG